MNGFNQFEPLLGPPCLVFKLLMNWGLQAAFFLCHYSAMIHFAYTKGRTCVH